MSKVILGVAGEARRIDTPEACAEALSRPGHDVRPADVSHLFAPQDVHAIPVDDFDAVYLGGVRMPGRVWLTGSGRRGGKSHMHAIVLNHVVLIARARTSRYWQRRLTWVRRRANGRRA